MPTKEEFVEELIARAKIPNTDVLDCNTVLQMIDKLYKEFEISFDQTVEDCAAYYTEGE